MCKRINRFIPVLFAGYIILSILAGIVIQKSGISLPIWGSYLLSQSIILLPALGYVLLYKINIVACIPYRRLKISDGLLSMLLGYMLIPFMLFVSNLTSLFAENYVQSSMDELMSYPFLVQLLIIAVLPACVEEFIFRGLIYHSYRKNGILGAALLSGVIFGCMHLNINQLSYALLMGVVFALLVEVTGSMYSSMLAHFAANSYSVIMLKLLTLVSDDSRMLTENSASLKEYPIPVIMVELIFLFVMAAGFLGLAFLVFRCMAKRNGRWEYLKTQLHKGLKPQNGERFLTVPVVVTVAAAVVYMIYMEFI